MFNSCDSSSEMFPRLLSVLFTKISFGKLIILVSSIFQRTRNSMIFLLKVSLHLVNYIAQYAFNLGTRLYGGSKSGGLYNESNGEVHV